MFRKAAHLWPGSLPSHSNNHNDILVTGTIVKTNLGISVCPSLMFLKIDDPFNSPRRTHFIFLLLLTVPANRGWTKSAPHQGILMFPAHSGSEWLF
jgi:hypothetical protein